MSARFVAVTVVLLAAPFVMSLASFVKSAPAASRPATRELTQLDEARPLQRKYGVAVVAMREPPGADSGPPTAGNRTATTDDRQPTIEPFACPEVRAIVSGDTRFAIVAWSDTSQVAVPGKSLSSPAGEVAIRRVGARSVSLSHDDITLNCQLSMR